MSRITIIGGSGFIGSHLCHLLLKEKEYEVVVLDKKPSSVLPYGYRYADVCDINTLLKEIDTCDAIVNLAAEHRDDVTPRSLYDEVNVQGAKNIVQVCKEKKIERILFISSVAVYGFAPKGTDESGAINYFNDYGRTKWEAEKVYREWLNEDPVSRSLTIIRPTVVFGEGNRGNVYSLMKQIASGCFVMIGNGNNIKSLAYVENVAAFIKYCLNNPPGEHLYNYVDKPDLTMNELVRFIKSYFNQKKQFYVHVPYWMGYFIAILLDSLSYLTKKKYPLSRIRIEKFCKDTQFNTSISLTTSFICPVSLEEGLYRTLCSEFGISNKNLCETP